MPRYQLSCRWLRRNFAKERGRARVRDLLSIRHVRMMRASTTAGIAGLLLITATGSCDVDPATCMSGACHPERTVNWLFRSDSPEDVDVLFVVDDSAPLPAALPAAYPRMARVLHDLPSPPNAISPGTAPPSVHVAFIPASFAGGGSCAPTETRGSACGLTGSDPFLSTIACGQRPNFAGSMEDAFACLADFDVAPACGPPQLFAAIRRALASDSSNGALSGFSRPGATLQVVIVASRDDASPDGDDAASLAAVLRAAKPDPFQIVVSVLGPSEACTSDPALAAPAPRLLALVRRSDRAASTHPSAVTRPRRRSCFSGTSSRCCSRRLAWRELGTDPAQAGVRPAAPSRSRRRKRTVRWRVPLCRAATSRPRPAGASAPIRRCAPRRCSSGSTTTPDGAPNCRRSCR